MNQKTSFLDLSQVYGASEEDLANLIASDKMHLKTRTGTLINPPQWRLTFSSSTHIVRLTHLREPEIFIAS